MKTKHSTDIFVISKMDTFRSKSSTLNLLNQDKNRSIKISFVQSLSPFYYLFRIFGLLSFSIVFDSNGDVRKAKLKIFDLLWLLFTICVYLYLGYFHYSKSEGIKLTDLGTILLVGDRTYIFFELIYGVIFVIMDLYNRQKIVGILKKISYFDSQVNLIRPIRMFKNLVFFLL